MHQAWGDVIAIRKLGSVTFFHLELNKFRLNRLFEDEEAKVKAFGLPFLISSHLFCTFLFLSFSIFLILSLSIYLLIASTFFQFFRFFLLHSKVNQDWQSFFSSFTSKKWLKHQRFAFNSLKLVIKIMKPDQCNVFILIWEKI